jgi:hypothetical protein
MITKESVQKLIEQDSSILEEAKNEESDYLGMY